MLVVVQAEEPSENWWFRKYPPNPLKENGGTPFPSGKFYGGGGGALKTDLVDPLLRGKVETECLIQ